MTRTRSEARWLAPVFVSSLGACTVQAPGAGLEGDAGEAGTTPPCTTDCADDSDGSGTPATSGAETCAAGSDGGPTSAADDDETGASDDDSPTTGDDDTGGVPGGIDTMCGDKICQDDESLDSCPFDCVPYEIAEMGDGVGQVCDRTHMGFVPITEIGSGSYLGLAQGGLYPGGSNTRPAAHTEAGLDAAAAIAPIDGSICFISIGMSNTGMKWNSFMQQGFPTIEDRDPAVVVANGAVGSNPVDTTADPSHGVWSTIDSQIASAGCSPEQVQVVWLLHAERGPNADFMTEAERFKSDLRATILNLDDHFENLQMIYMSARSYAGYGDKNNNPEPYAHQTAFVVKWLIEDQILGNDPALSIDGGAPWLSWGPYLWADGLGADDVLGGTPGRLIPDDGMEYECSDFSSNDGIHPGPGMLHKASAQLVDFLTTDETAAAWLLQ
ncbi:MAG: hypothetical protein AAF721_15110 [Myxococcota bacterium]